VVAYLLDLNGNRVATIGSALTDASGAFSLTVEGFSAASSSVLLEATPDTGTPVRALLGGLDQAISPATDGVTAFVLGIVGTPQGRALTDFTPAELSALFDAGATALTTAGTDLADPVAVRADLLAALGGQLSTAAGGTVTYTAAQPLPAPAGVLTPGSNPLDLTDGSGTEFELDPNGVICGDEWDCAFYLSINGSGFNPQNGAQFQVQDGREFVLGPVVNFAGTGLDVTRKVFISADHSYLRAADFFSNPGASDVTGVTVNLNNYWDSPTSGFITSSGDALFDAADFWMADGSPSSLAVGFFAPGFSFSPDGPGQFDATQVIDVPAGATAATFAWAFQTGSVNGLPEVLSTIQALGVNPPADFYEGISDAELALSVTPLPLPDVFGAAGSAAPGETLTVTNATSGESRQAQAGLDGSFVASLPAASGDSIEIAGSAGTSHTLSVP